VALRQVAEEVEAKRIPAEPVNRPRDDRLLDTHGPQAIGERLLALIHPRPGCQRIVRRAWRSAQRLGAELDVLWVADHDATPEEQEQLDALRRLASVLGAHLLIEHGDDIALVTQQVAQERGTTYVLMGTPKKRGRWARMMRPALPFRLLRLLPGIDLRIVADRSQRVEPEGRIEPDVAPRMDVSHSPQARAQG
jgi:two-component system, OmpR family, sensor histidine kinase KdpD